MTFCVVLHCCVDVQMLRIHRLKQGRVEAEQDHDAGVGAGVAGATAAADAVEAMLDELPGNAAAAPGGSLRPRGGKLTLGRLIFLNINIDRENLNSECSHQVTV